jgi:DNA repair ATPase RecN
VLKIMAPISVGELLDKISILQIKQSFAKDPIKLSNINTELIELQALCPTLTDDLEQLYQQLKTVNQELWHIEDYKRACERDETFHDGFVNAARQVYIKNDLRAEIKKKINLATGSHIIEEKIY